MPFLITEAGSLNFSRNIIEQIAQPENFLRFQGRIVADVECEEVTELPKLMRVFQVILSLLAHSGFGEEPLLLSRLFSASSISGERA